MQQLDAITLRALSRELQTLLDNAKVSKVQHPSAHEFLITFWGGPDRPEHLNLLFIQLNPEAPFCALTDTKRRQDTALHSFEKPTALCMLLRKQLHGASLKAVRTLPAERVLELVFENYNELGNKVRLVLSLELMGKHTNMLLYDEVQGVLLAVAHGVSEVMSQYRELAAGLPYAPPPKPPGKQLLSAMTEADFLNFVAQKSPEESLNRFLNANLAGFGQRILEDTLALGGEPKQGFQRLNALENGENLHPAISLNGERFTLVEQIDASQWQTFPNVNAMVGEYFTTHWRTMRVHRHRQQLMQILERQLKKLQQREKELVPGAADEIQTLQATGDRLLAAVSSREVPEHPTAHQGTVQLLDYASGQPQKIAIDPSCGWVENAQIYYRRAKKAKARRDIYEQISAALHAEREYIDTLMQLVRQAETVADLTALEADIAQVGTFKPELNAFDVSDAKQAQQPLAGAKKNSQKNQKDKKKTAKGKPEKYKSAAFSGVASFTSTDGLEILLGKSGQGNDAIVGKLSRTDDLWLHVHQMPGSHVLVRTGKGDVPDQTLLEAAMLAVYYSSARSSLNVPVIYTQSKFVRKIPHSYPGHVNYRQEQTVFITPEAPVVDRLLQTARQPDGN